MPVSTKFVGFGKNTVGGSGGKPYFITNTSSGLGYQKYNNATPVSPGATTFTHWEGTLLSGVSEVTGARIITPRVSGTITYSYGTYLYFNQGNITLAFHTAPGDGLFIKGGFFHTNNHNNIIFVQMRQLARTLLDGLPSGVDSVCLILGVSSNVVVDHCSFGWANDDTVISFGTNNTTISNNIIAEGVVEGGKGYWNSGCLLSYASGTVANGAYNSVYKNLFAANQKRAPLFGSGMHHEAVNNVQHNVGTKTNFHGVYAAGYANVIKNYCQDPSSITPLPYQLGGSIYTNSQFITTSEFYALGNYNPANPTATQRFMYWEDDNGQTHVGSPIYPSTRPSWGLVYQNEVTAQAAFNEVTATNGGAGAYLTTDSNGDFVAARNSFETRVLANTIANSKTTNDSSGRINSNPQTEIIGGASYPSPATGATAFTDSNYDGIPDSYTLPGGKVASDLRDDGFGTFYDGYLFQSPRYWDAAPAYEAPVISHSSPYTVTAGTKTSTPMSVSDADSDMTTLDIVSTGNTSIYIDNASGLTIVTPKP